MASLRYWLLLPFVCLSLTGAAQKSGSISRQKVGLVLGGGGAKGAAEVGVLKYIEKAGVPIDYIAGTSIGSIVGGLYAVGYRSAELDSMFRSQEWTDLLTDRDNQYKGKIITRKEGTTYVLGFPVKKRKGRGKADSKGGIGLLRGDRIVALLDSMTHCPDSLSFDDLPIPFRCVAVDIATQREVVLGHGSLSTAMRASMAIPGAFKPVHLDSLTLVDGGMLNNLPVDVVRQMGADVVIAIDLTQNKHATRDFSLKDKLGIGGLLDWLVSRPDWRKYNENREAADFYINPDLSGYNAASFNPEAISQMIAIGEQAGQEQLKALKKFRKQVMRRKRR